jgi:DNA-binding NarL/FixJ family response regulator
VLFADDHRVLRQGLMKLLAGRTDVQVVGEAASGREALERARQLKPEVVVMDVSMPGMDGIEATRLIKAELPDVQVLGLSVFEEEEVAQRMRQAGAEGLVSKSASSGELLKAIHRAASAGRRKPAPR